MTVGGKKVTNESLSWPGNSLSTASDHTGLNQTVVNVLNKEGSISSTLAGYFFVCAHPVIKK